MELVYIRNSDGAYVEERLENIFHDGDGTYILTTFGGEKYLMNTRRELINSVTGNKFAVESKIIVD